MNNTIEMNGMCVVGRESGMLASRKMVDQSLDARSRDAPSFSRGRNEKPNSVLSREILRESFAESTNM